MKNSRESLMKTAAELLSVPELNISEIAYRLNFRDPRYFSRCFRNVWGMTPTDYRRALVAHQTTKPIDTLFIRNAFSVIQKEISNHQYRPNRLASDLYVSKSTMWRKFKNETGKTPTEFIRYVRLHNAANLLAKKEVPVSEVAELVGYRDMKYFRKSFMRELGISLTDFIGK